MIEPSTLRLVDNSIVSKGDVNSLAAPMGLLLAHPNGVKAAKSHIEVLRMKHMTTKDSAASMSKMASCHTKIAAVIICK